MSVCSAFQDPKSLPPSLPASLMSLMTGGSSKSTLAAPSKPKIEETPAQKQAAAKLALRKELEKTLLQVTGCLVRLFYRLSLWKGTLVWNKRARAFPLLRSVPFTTC